MADSWTMKGTVLISCNCDYGCPCNFNALPTAGKCEGEWTWHVEQGAYGATDLSGLTFTLAVNDATGTDPVTSAQRSSPSSARSWRRSRCGRTSSFRRRPLGSPGATCVWSAETW